MSDAQSPTPHYHTDEARFREALRSAEAETGFNARLIEKDYYCSVVLRDFGQLFREKGLVFKGGTSLSKVHSRFFRLSEDLDFGISVKTDASRSVRRKAIDPFKLHFAEIVTRLPFLEIEEKLEGRNNSTQYNAKLAYRAALTGEKEFLKVEVAVREGVLVPAVSLEARTLLIDPRTKEEVIPPFAVTVLTLGEAYAEKARAALTRLEPAIRDFFDLDNAAQQGHLNHLDEDYLRLVKRKLDATDDPVVTSPKKYEQLKAQLEGQLKPVLRASEFDAFALERAITIVEAIATRASGIT